MSRKLIAPGVTGGEWWTVAGRTETGIPFEISANGICHAKAFHIIDARFLAGSKRVSEAAADVVNEWQVVHVGPIDGDLLLELIDRLHGALIAQGYKEIDK